MEAYSVQILEKNKVFIDEFNCLFNGEDKRSRNLSEFWANKLWS